MAFLLAARRLLKMGQRLQLLAADGALKLSIAWSFQALAHFCYALMDGRQNEIALLMQAVDTINKLSCSGMAKGSI